MTKIKSWVLILLLLSSSGTSLFFMYLSRSRSMTVQDHSFSFDPVRFLVLFLICSLSIFVLWITYSKAIAVVFHQTLSSTSTEDAVTFTPCIIFFLLPLTSFHYLSASDLTLRLFLLGVAVLFFFFYLKILYFLRAYKKSPNFFRNLREKFARLPTKKKLLIFFLAALVLYNTGAAVLTTKEINFSGDEPHFILIAHSLLTDGDFDLSNNYADHDYRNYMHSNVRLDPHTSPPTKGKYSFHSPGIAFLILPFYGLGLLLKGSSLIFLIRFGISIFGALLGLQIYLFALQTWKNEKLAFRLWILYSFTAPVFFYSIHFYPEIIVALLSLTYFRLVRCRKSFSRVTLLVLGLLISTFVWFHILKYMFLTAALFLYGVWTLLRKHRIGWRILYYLAFPLLLTFLYFIFQYSLYDSYSLSAVSWRGALSAGESLSYLKSLLQDIPFRYQWETLAGFFLDQRDGLFFYAPIYFFAFLGAVELLKRKSKDLLLLLFIAGPYVLYLAFLTQRTGYAPQARPLVAVSWVFIVLVGHFLAANGKKIFSILFSAATFFSFLFISILMLDPRALYQLTTVGETQHAGKLFLHLSNLHFFLPEFLPSFLKISGPAWKANFYWMIGIVFFMAAYAFTKKHDFTLTSFFHKALVASALILFFFWFAFFPRIVMLYPNNVSFPGGDKISFYYLGRVAQMKQPGRFDLPEDDRVYIFYFSSWKKIEDFTLEFGSLAGSYDIRIQYYDMDIFEGSTSQEIRSLPFHPPHIYKFKNRNLYQLILTLQNTSNVSTAQHPFKFSILPVR